MWNKIFKHKSSKSSSASQKNRKNSNAEKDDVGDRCSVSETYNGGKNDDDTSVPTLTPTTPVPSFSKSSKFSKVVNSFSLKRGSKENRNAVPVAIIRNNSDLTITNGNNFESVKRGFVDENDRIIVGKDHDKLNELLLMDDNSIPLEPINLELKPCPICTRTFVPDTLKKHVNICEKMAMKKRKIFDSSKQRREGTDLAAFLPKGYSVSETKIKQIEQKISAPKLGQVQQSSAISPISPKQQNDSVSKELPSSAPVVTATTTIQKKSSSPAAAQLTTTTPTASTPIAIRQEAKQKAERKRNLLPPSEPCPYCERCFGIKAYDRHVEWCKEKTRLLANRKNQTKTAAKERLEARIKYKAPCLKSKRAANREKYSGFSCDETDSNYSKTSPDDHPKLSMSTSLSSSIMSESPSKENRQNISAISSNKSPTNKKTKITCNNNIASSTQVLGSLSNVSLVSLRRGDTEITGYTTYEVSSSSEIELKINRPAILENSSKKVTVGNSKKKNFIKANVLNTKQSQKTCSTMKPIELVKESKLNKTFIKPNVASHTLSLPMRKKSVHCIKFQHEDNVVQKDSPKTLYQVVDSSKRELSELIVTQCDLSTFKNKKIENDSHSTTLIRNETFSVEKRAQNHKQNEKNETNVDKSKNNFDKLSKKNDDSDQEISILEKTYADNTSVCLDSISNWSMCKTENCSSGTGSEYGIYMLPKEDEISKLLMSESELERNTFISQNKKYFQTENEISNNLNINCNDEVKAGSTISKDLDLYDLKLSGSSNSKSFEPQNCSVGPLPLGGMSDKYDPFLSAKRQLEELCSPTSTEPPITPITPTTPNSTTKLPSNLSSSFTAKTTNTSPSNFRRTSSLRVSRKKTPPTFHHQSSRPVFCPQSKERPTIQRGISDEGPISSNFLKPEEYDEMPVKSACVNDLAISHHHHHNSPKIVKRDANSSVNRRNIRLNLNNNKLTSNKLSSPSSIAGTNPISKTDSLAIFLKYENETKKTASSTSPISASTLTKLTEKDLKDKTNTNLSKNQTQITNKLPSINAFDNSNNNSNRFKEINSIMTINKIQPIKLEPIQQSKIISINSANLPNENNNNTNMNSISNNLQLTQKSNKPQPLNLSSILDSKDSTDFIDPKLINVCDNLPIHITKISDSDFTSSSTDSVSTAKFTNNYETIDATIITDLQQQHQQQQQQQQQQKQHTTPPSSNRSSSERRNLLNRQLRLGKNQFLYDMSPEADVDDDDDDDEDNNDVIIDSYSDECDKIISMIDTSNDDNNDQHSNIRKNNNNSNRNGINSNLDEPPIFDDFDFEEFLSSFDENDEAQYPIFKDYKKFLMMNRSINKQYEDQQQKQTNNNHNTQNNDNNFNLNNNNNNSSLILRPTTATISTSGTTKINNDDEEDEFCDDDIDIELRKNEIFISIETNQNDDINNLSPSLMPLSPSPPLLPAPPSQQQQQQHSTSNPCSNDGDSSLENDKKINEKILDELNENSKKFIEELEKIDNNSENDFDESKTIRNMNNSSNSNNNNQLLTDNIMMFQLQDSDEISSSVDENFPLHDRSANSVRSTKQNADSAYGSLSRHSPDPIIRRNSSRTRGTGIGNNNMIMSIENQQQQLPSPILKSKYSTSSPLWNNESIIKRRNRNFSASSSGSSSDNSLPLSSQQHHYQQSQKTIGDSKSQPQQQQDQQLLIDKKYDTLKMSKFCHECGSKFIISQAKFCMECGVKRIIIE